MKIGFNEGCNRFCENHSVLEDLDLCEKYGFDYIDIQSECLDREIAAGKYTIDDLAAWFADPKHHLKMLSYNALIFFNMKQTQEEKDAVMAKLDQIIEDCNKLQCKMIVVVPSMDLTVPATLDEIKADAVAVLKEMVKKVEPHGIKLSIEFCGPSTASRTLTRSSRRLTLRSSASPSTSIISMQWLLLSRLSRRPTARRSSYGT